MSFTAAEKGQAAWALKVYKESGRSRTTARALHYFALGRLDYPIFKPKGVRPYTDSDADHITDWIALAKRMGLISWDSLPDNTVGERGELVFQPARSELQYKYSLNRFELYSLQEYLKKDQFSRLHTPIKRDQPYHMELWVEKSTMNNILQPICKRFNSTLVTFKGHCSWGGSLEAL